MISRKYLFDPVALTEYHDALTWYGQQSIMAMEHFEKEIDAAIISICRSPTTFRKTFQFYREANLKKFPYSIVFFLHNDSDTIVISAIYHHSRDPIRKYHRD